MATNTKTNTRTKQHQYFIKLSDKKRSHFFFVGPFETQDEAEKKVERDIQSGKNIVLGQIPQDMPDALSAEIEPRIKARRSGLRSPEGKEKDSVNTVLPDIPNADEWDKLPAPELSNRGRKRKIDSITDKKPKTSSSVAIAKSKTIQPELSKDVNVQPPKINGTAKKEKTFYAIGTDGMIEWLKIHHGIDAKKVKWITKEMAQDGYVIGELPSHLDALTEWHGSIATPFLRPDQRHRELSLQELEEAGATLLWYHTERGEGPKLK